MALSVQTHQAISGSFRVAHVHEGRARSGGRFLRLGLVRDAEILSAYAFADSCQGFRRPRQGEEVRIHGRLRLRNGVPEIRCETLCPQNIQPALDWARVRARLMWYWLDHAPLRAMLLEVFREPDLLLAFMARPASLAHHHAYPGGLFVHSVEVAWHLFQQPVASDEKALLVAAGLFHDIGKIRCYSADGQRTLLGQQVAHEALTLELLAPHLHALDALWPDGAARLRQLLTWRASREVPRPPDALIDLLRCADRLSAHYESKTSPHAGAACPVAKPRRREGPWEGSTLVQPSTRPRNLGLPAPAEGGA